MVMLSELLPHRSTLPALASTQLPCVPEIKPVPTTIDWRPLFLIRILLKLRIDASQLAINHFLLCPMTYFLIAALILSQIKPNWWICYYLGCISASLIKKLWKSLFYSLRVGWLFFPSRNLLFHGMTFLFSKWGLGPSQLERAALQRKNSPTCKNLERRLFS